MKQYIRTFSVGLFIASLILFITFLMCNSSINNRGNVSDEEMVERLEDSGYRAVTESEYISVAVQQDKNKDQKNDKNKDSQDKKEDQNANKQDKDQDNDKQNDK